ncbi:hypothetical protein ACM66Z_00675 [Sulfurovum sp. ST-21]|uniref:Rad50/SbcC-type AAA domain-containing protein n=1 Tax=Sulfurovum indicum TaxID=2779528 RepID=A0A7M1S4B6_9BACT|nr:hypothetical protein [Sulfurovum indicum]QOR62034.1 hypothetical protein IMZ28_00675 [Sulfurovum indicum]
MKNLYFKQLLLLSNSQKSANLFEFKKGYNLITANDNSVGKSTLVKLLLWAMGCEPELDGTWKSLDCKVLLHFSINEINYSVLRDANLIYLKEGDKDFIKFTSISGDYSKVFSQLVDFKVLLPDRSEDTQLITPPPAYYFLPFYIDQKRSWAKAWDNFEKLTQLANWNPTVIKYHVGYLQAKHFEYEEEYHIEQKKIKEYMHEVEKIDYALEVVTSHTINAGNTEVTLDSTVFEDMTQEIQKELLDLSNQQEDILNNLSNVMSDKAYLEHQKSLAEHLMKELDKDYVFSVENIDSDEVECPLCGVIHENSLVNRASILSDKEQANEQLITIDSKLKTVNNKIINLRKKSTDIKSKINEINAKYTVTDESKQLQLNEVIETFAYQSIDRNIKETKKEKLLDIEDCKENQKSIKKDQSKLLPKERKDDINNAFMDLLKTYIKILDVEELSLAKVNTPLNYNPIIKEGGAAEGARGILAYYLAIYSLSDMYADEVISPLIIDTPNQQEQSHKNYENIMKLITTKIPSDKQVIMCAMENNILKEYEEQANIINLDKSKLLKKSKYTQIKTIFDEIEG